ncbi:MAG TPA: hypothetical protein VGH38_09920 [Bryobacteraceae bacterium]
MHGSQQLVLFYFLFWLVRINGSIRRGRQPLLRGPGWFFNMQVPPDFHTGAGKKILHRYWIRMLIPFAVDIPLAVAIFVFGRLDLLVWLILGLCALIHLNHLFSVDLAERQARPFAVSDARQPVSLVLSLTPRRLRDYSSPKVEWALALADLVALVGLTAYWLAAPEHHNLRFVFGAPAVSLYLQAGMLFIKHIIVAWRTPVPEAQAAEHMEAREQTRKYYLGMCDCYRAVFAAGILLRLILIGRSPESLNRLSAIWFGASMAIGIVATVWVEIRRKQLVNLALRTHPVELPDLLDQSKIARWPVCYEPSVPMLILKGARGYSLNLANTFACVGAAWLVGLVTLLALLPQRH